MTWFAYLYSTILSAHQHTHAHAHAHTHTHTQSHTHTLPFNGPLSGTTRVSRYQKGKTNLDFTEARDSEWQWHQLGRMQVCISLQTDNHANTPPHSFYRPDALPAAQPTVSKHWRPSTAHQHTKCSKNSSPKTLYHKFLITTFSRFQLINKWLKMFD